MTTVRTPLIGFPTGVNPRKIGAREGAWIRNTCTHSISISCYLGLGTQTLSVSISKCLGSRSGSRNCLRRTREMTPVIAGAWFPGRSPFHTCLPHRIIVVHMAISEDPCTEVLASRTPRYSLTWKRFVVGNRIWGGHIPVKARPWHRHAHSMQMRQRSGVWCPKLRTVEAIPTGMHHSLPHMILHLTLEL